MPRALSDEFVARPACRDDAFFFDGSRTALSLSSSEIGAFGSFVSSGNPSFNTHHAMQASGREFP